MLTRIEINADIMQGNPVIRGTQIPVELLRRKLADGASTADLLSASQTSPPPLLSKTAWDGGRGN